MAHATPTPTSRSKGQKSKSRGGGILWRPPSRTACYTSDTFNAKIDIKSNKINLSLFHMNIRSLNKNTEEQEMRSVELGVCPMQLFHF